MTRIFIFALSDPILWDTDLIGHAMSEHGEILASHISSTKNFVRYDMGLTSDHKHDTYTAAYPDHELIDFVDKTMEECLLDPVFNRAWTINQRNAKP